jgi:hypothetical protein
MGFPPGLPSGVDAVLAAACAWIAIGAAGHGRAGQPAPVARVLYPAGALVGVALGAAALARRSATAESTRVLPLGLPVCRSMRGSTRFRPSSSCCSPRSRRRVGVHRGLPAPRRGAAPGVQCLCHHVFLASMALVLVPTTPTSSWWRGKPMALSSFFLVTSDHRHAEIRRAGYLYLLIAHLGAISILLCFGALQAGTGDYSFDADAALQQPPAGAASPSRSRSPASAPRPASCRCTCGCPRRTLPRLRRCRR